MTTQDVLEKVVKQSLEKASKEDVVELARAFWHEEFLPVFSRVKSLSNEQQRRTGYLTEFFSGFNCIDEKRIRELVATAGRIRSISNPVINSENVDEIAGEWGLSDNINCFLPDILPYQTRHYKHPSNR